MTNSKVINISGIIVIGIIFCFCYYDTLHWMYGRYISSDSYYSHGFLVPFVSLVLIWMKKNQLRDFKQQGAWMGLFCVVLALLLHVTGTVVYVFSISGFSIFFLSLGLSLFIFGRQITKAILFPLVFLIFMFPLPEAFISLFSFPLKMLAAKVGAWLVSLFGIPIHQEGFNITIPNGRLLVDNPCSGLRSLISFLALGAIFAYISNLSLIKKWVLFVLSVPTALFSNMVRVPILIMVSHYWGLEAAMPDTFVHTGSGMLVFVLGFLFLLFGMKVLEW